MSRRPTAGRSTSGIARTASSASIAMPPPSKIPNNRPPSVTSTSGASHRNGEDGGESRSNSPNRKGRKTTGVVGVGSGHGAGKGKGAESSNVTENGEINIQVVVRCRGRSSQEVAQASPVITTTTGPISKAITVETTPLPSSSMATFTTASAYGGSHQPMTKTYPFDKVFGPEADQTMIFNEVAEGMLDEVLAGYNCTIFAYGQTGTGKTYTMQGDLELTNLNAPKSTAGIVPRVLHRLFSLLENSANTEYSVKCSYIELYNEELRDLLATEYKGDGPAAQQQQNGNNGGGGLKLYEDGKKGVYIQGLEETGVRNLKEGLGIVDKGVKRRQTAETKMNTESSRSHTIFSITVHVKESGLQRGGEDLLKVGKFNLVDLAGSEAIGRSGATDKRAREAGMINQSLLTLGRVISALVEKGSHIPYRESKLTRLLQDSLGGRTKTCIVATVSPTRSNMEETLSTLDYAIRAKSIRNRPEVNAHMTKTGLLKEYVGDIERLKVELMAAREKNGIYIPEDQWREMHELQAKQKSDYDEAKLKASMIEVELVTIKKEFDDVSVRLLTTADELVQVREAERQLTEMLDETKVILERVRVQLEEEMAVSQAYMKGEERLDQVAGSLKKVATESVSDVGGLFDKLARKAKVLGSNADAATKFGGKLQGLSNELRGGLAQLHSAQNGFGQEVKSEVETYAINGQGASQRDLAALDKSFSVFNDLAKRMTASNEKGQREASETSKTLLAVKEEVQTSVREWAKGVSDRSQKMVEDLLEHQQEHLTMVGSVLDSTADLVDAVITTARDHLAAEAASSAASRDLALRASSSEISRLQSQNLLLARLLSQEKAKTAKLRTELIDNLTSMIENFTDAQDASWTEVVNQVQVENVRGVQEMERFDEDVRGEWERGERRREGVRGDFAVGEETGSKQREAGRSALGDVREGVRERLQVYGKETTEEAESHVKVVDAFCTRMGKGASDVSSKASSRGKKQADLLSALSHNVAQTHQASQSRARATADDIASISSNLLASQSTASSLISQAHANSQTTLETMFASTARFLESGIGEDVPTGITPRKKAWNVQTEWTRTGSREAVLASWRQRQASGEDGGVEAVAHSNGGHSPAEEEGNDTSRENTVALNGEAASSKPPSREPTPTVSSAIPNPSLLSASQNGPAPGLRQPSSTSGIPSKSKLTNGKKMGGAEEIRPTLTVLGEGVGLNVPRRTRK
ncbi:hypothetical protein IAR55_003270 [Kwoniella newhampshirensis]|uniref:Kinesin motor domain-containing protein n=1 Tax=Kwoniella newhampshirensis TaxID=1651941 RepID=A0AAW0YQH2_9TREE